MKVHLQVNWFPNIDLTRRENQRVLLTQAYVLRLKRYTTYFTMTTANQNRPFDKR